MKKTILSLMLSASILTASPLFAMEEPNDPSEPLHKTAIKRTAPIGGGENPEPQPKVGVKKLVERAMTLLEEFRDDEKNIDTSIINVSHAFRYIEGIVGFGIGKANAPSEPQQKVDVDPKLVERT